MHRFTGIVLYFSVIAIVWYIIYYTYQVNPAESVDSCDCPLQKIMDNLFALASIGITFSLFYHLLNGIRHLLWDVGYGFEVKTAKRNGYLVVLTSVLLTALAIGAVFYLKNF